MKTKIASVAILCCLLSTSLFAQKAANQDLVRVDATVESIILEPLSQQDTYFLTIQGQDVLKTVEFDGKDLPFIDLYANDGWLPDGAYSWSLSAKPIIDDETKAAMQWARETGDYSVLNELRKNGYAPMPVASQSGSFAVVNGQFVVNQDAEPAYVASALKNGDDGRPDGVEPGRVDPNNDGSGTVDEGSNDFDDDSRGQFFATDLSVDGSACVGTDCTSSESFGFDTLRLKENNLRIKFDDTSSSGSFPNNDWQITANDSGNGGANKFSIDDITGSKTPFTIEAGAPNNALYVDSNNGHVGIGKKDPVVKLHVVDGDSPTMRLEQDGSSGFTAQTWDLAGNETNFFVRDVTSGSKLPFKIKPGGDDNTLVLDSDNNVGFGILNPTVRLHAAGTDGATSILVDENSGTTADRTMLELENNGGSVIRMEDSSDSSFWLTANTNGAFRIIGSDGARFTLTDAGRLTIGTTASSTSNFDLDASNGNVIIQGGLTEMSDRNSKEDIVPVDNQAILNKVTELEIAEWSYIDTPGVRHMGPMAQDFRAAFGLGFSETGMATRDLSAVAVASIKALNEQLQDKNTEIEELATQNQELQKRLERIEAALKLNEQK